MVGLFARIVCTQRLRPERLYPTGILGKRSGNVMYYKRQNCLLFVLRDYVAWQRRLSEQLNVRQNAASGAVTRVENMRFNGLALSIHATKMGWTQPLPGTTLAKSALQGDISHVPCEWKKTLGRWFACWEAYCHKTLSADSGVEHRD